MQSNKTIVISGIGGSGKTHISKELADRINFQFIDVDHAIEDNIKDKIYNFISTNGVENFREIESNILEKCLRKNGNKVISLGGGAIISEKNRETIYKFSDKIIHIKVDVETIVQRILNDHTKGNVRPSLSGNGEPMNREEILQIYEQRKNIYANSCDFAVMNNGTVDECINKILEKIHTGNICLPITNFDEKNLQKAFEEIRNEPSIKYVELRIDYLKDKDKINEIIKQCPKKVVVTNRHSCETGNFEGSFEKSTEILSQIEGATYIDIEVKAGNNIQKLKQTLENKNTGLITSYHNFEKTESLKVLKNKLKEMNQYNPDVYKIAMIPKSKEDVEIIYELTNYFKENYKGKDFIFISMGELGKQTRIDIPKVGGIITFGTKDNRGTAPGQIHFKKLQNKLYS